MKKQKLVSQLLILVMLLQLLTAAAAPVSAASFAGGSGTAEDPYQIATAEQLAAIGQNPDASYLLVEDIDLSQLGSWRSIDYFGGTLDGGGHTISGLTITEPTMESSTNFLGEQVREFTYGLIWYCRGVCRNLTLTDVQVSLSLHVGHNDSVTGGVLAGYLEGSIEQCTTEGTARLSVTEDGTDQDPEGGPFYHIGGLVGWSNEGAVITASRSGCSQELIHNAYYGTENAFVCIGGICGWNISWDMVNRSVISDCVNDGAITMEASGWTTHHIGGIVGMSEYMKLQNCENNGSLTLVSRGSDSIANSKLGGVCAVASDSLLTACVNRGELSFDSDMGDAQVAGIVANTWMDEITGCVNYGKSLTAATGGGSAELGRIYALSFELGTLSGNQSLADTLLNGSPAVTELGHNQKNGENIEGEPSGITCTVEEGPAFAGSYRTFTVEFPQKPVSAYLQFDYQLDASQWLEADYCREHPLFKIEVEEIRQEGEVWRYEATFRIHSQGLAENQYHRQVRVVAAFSGREVMSEPTAFAVLPIPGPTRDSIGYAYAQIGEPVSGGTMPSIGRISQKPDGDGGVILTVEEFRCEEEDGAFFWWTAETGSFYTCAEDFTQVGFVSEGASSVTVHMGDGLGHVTQKIVDLQPGKGA